MWPTRPARREETGDSLDRAEAMRDGLQDPLTALALLL